MFTTLVEHARPRELGCFFLTRLGWVRVRFSERGLSELAFEDDNFGGSRSDGVFRDAFLEWLADFDSFEAEEQWRYLDPHGTDFQKSVWRALLEIPFGEHTSYGEIARQVGRPKASRAVGAAVGANPISLLIPCHRVLPGSGRLGNYRWGVDRKQELLDAEAEPGSGLCSLFE